MTSLKLGKAWAAPAKLVRPAMTDQSKADFSDTGRISFIKAGNPKTSLQVSVKDHAYGGKRMLLLTGIVPKVSADLLHLPRREGIGHKKSSQLALTAFAKRLAQW